MPGPLHLGTGEDRQLSLSPPVRSLFADNFAPLPHDEFSMKPKSFGKRTLEISC